MAKTHAEWMARVRKQWRKRPADTPLSHAARLVRLEAEAGEGTGNVGRYNRLMDIADTLEDFD